MGVREALNRRPRLVAAATVALIAGAALWAALAMGGAGGKADHPLAFFSDDDGQTYFEDSVFRIAPFDRGGREAVRARVFTADGGRTRFVGYLEKYAPEARARFSAIEGDVPRQLDLVEQLRGGGVVVKKPGQSEWVPGDSPQAAAVRKVIGPGGAPVTAVLPDEDL